jgi:hypothetical protein
MYSSEKKIKGIYRSKLQNRGVRLSKDYKVNNLKNKDISVVAAEIHTLLHTNIL